MRYWFIIMVLNMNAYGLSIYDGSAGVCCSDLLELQSLLIFGLEESCKNECTTIIEMLLVLICSQVAVREKSRSCISTC